MGRGSVSQISTINVDNVYSVKPKIKKGIEPHFLLKKIVDRQVTEEEIKETSLSGELKKISFNTSEWQGKKIESLKLTLVDIKASEMFFIDFGIDSGVCRSLMNSLCSINSSHNFIELSLYIPKGKDYASLSVKNNGAPLRWKFDSKELPAAYEIRKPSTKELIALDYSLQVNLLKKNLQQVIDTYFVNNSVPSNELEHEINSADSPTVSQSYTVPSTVPSVEEDDLPF